MSATFSRLWGEPQTADEQAENLRFTGDEAAPGQSRSAAPRRPRTPEPSGQCLASGASTVCWGCSSIGVTDPYRCSGASTQCVRLKTVTMHLLL